MILKTAVSHRGTETTEAADKELYLRKALKNCYPLGEDKAPEKRPPFHVLCALCDSVTISTAGFRTIDRIFKNRSLHRKAASRSLSLTDPFHCS
jgi:hypothetical protein